jgi:hypothetical protein
LCGRFTRDQLDRLNLSLRPEPQPSTWRSALFALAGVACAVPAATATTLQSPIVATAGQPAAPEEKASQEPSTAQEQQAGALPILKGRVLRESDEQPIGGVSVGVVDTKLSTTTDAEGRFQIDLGLMADPPRQIRLAVHHENYRTDFLTVATADVPPELTIRLQEEEWLVGVILVDEPMTTYEPVYKRTWQRLWPFKDR